MNDERSKVEIFGKPIALKSIGCNHEDMPGGPIPPSVNLFVKVTNACNASCLFCSNAGCRDHIAFDFPKLIEIIHELQAKNIIVNRLNITGGEPSVTSSLVENILDKLSSREFADIHIHLNTNGLLPSSQHLMKHPRWDSISVSIHHYDTAKLSEIYGVAIPDSALNFEGIDMNILNASCNLVKGFIDSTEEAHKMMDLCIDREIKRLGFVGLMPVNDFCRTNYVSLDTLQLDNIPHCYFTESKNRGADCRCSNYLYNRNLKVLEIYMRHYANPYYCESSLLYDGQYLRQGFHDDNIIY